MNFVKSDWYLEDLDTSVQSLIRKIAGFGDRDDYINWSLGIKPIDKQCKEISAEQAEKYWKSFYPKFTDVKLAKEDKEGFDVFSAKFNGVPCAVIIPHDFKYVEDTGMIANYMDCDIGVSVIAKADDFQKATGISSMSDFGIKRFSKGGKIKFGTKQFASAMNEIRQYAK